MATLQKTVATADDGQVTAYIQYNSANNQLSLFGATNASSDTITATITRLSDGASFSRSLAPGANVTVSIPNNWSTTTGYSATVVWSS